MIATPNGAFALLLGSLFVLSVQDIVTFNSWLKKAGFWLISGSWLWLSGFLAQRWIQAGRAPLSNQYESLVFLCWAFLGLHLMIGRQLPARRPGVWAALFALFLLALASFLDPEIRPLVPALQSNWLLLHVSVTMMAYAALAFSFISALACFWSFWSGQNEWDKTADAFTYNSISLGFILLTLGIILGAVWANETWGSYWSWDPKETWSLITWMAYAVALHLRHSRGWRGTRFASLSVAGFLCVVFTYFGVNYLMSGLHAYG